MRVLHIVTAFPRREGDPITPWLVETLRRLASRGIESDVFVSSYKGLKNQKIYGINVFRFRYFFRRMETLTHDENAIERLKKGIFYRILVFFYLLGGMRSMTKLRHTHNYDIIHVHWPIPHIVFGYLAKLIFRAKLVSTFYSVELRFVKKKMPILTPLLRWTLVKSDAVIGISSYVHREIKEVKEVNVDVIPFGAATSVQTKSIPARKGGEKTILFVGRLVERKGISYLIEAFRMVRETLPARLIIVGDGSERNRLETLTVGLGLQQCVTFTGWIPREELERLYSRSDVFVLPAIVDSRGDTEGLGVVLIEAMSNRKPVVASEVGGIVDIVKDGKTGLTVPEKDVKALANAVTKLLKDEKLARKLGEDGYKYVREKFNWDTIIGKTIAVYENLTSTGTVIRGQTTGKQNPRPKEKKSGSGQNRSFRKL